MKKSLWYVIVLACLFIPMISAIDTAITIKTIPYHEVQITAFNPSTSSFESWGSLKNYSDQYGDASFTFSSDKYNFNLIVFIKKDNEKVMAPKKFLDNFEAGEPIYLEVAPSGFEFIETPNQVEEEIELIENETIQNETIEDSEPVTSFAIFGEGGLFSINTFYVVTGIILILGIAGFFLFKKMKKGIKTPKEIKIKKLSELNQEKKEDIRDNRAIIEDAERKIREAQEEIRKIKNEDKIKEAKKKLIEDQKELMRLREGKE